MAQHIAELAARVTELTRRLELYEGVSGNGNRALSQQTTAPVRDEDDSAPAIEFITENGFSIVRPWEADGAPAPAEGKCRFSVGDGFAEREITVEISSKVAAEIELRTRGRVQLSSLFWIYCAERHLANYLAEHEHFPEQNELIVATPDREDILLAMRWEECG